MKTTVLGSGGWGTALALVLCDNGHDVTLWSHSPEKAGQMAQTRENSLLKGVLLPESLHITGELDCLSDAELVISAPPSFAVRATGEKIRPYLRPETVLVTVSKGIERETGLRMSQVLQETTGNIRKVVALSGPSHAEEVGRKLPTGCVSACPDRAAARFVQDAFMNDYFRIYTSYDIIGVELAAALKNVVALSCGICTGLGLQDNTKALLMTGNHPFGGTAGRHPANLRRSCRHGGSDRHLHLSPLPKLPGGYPYRAGQKRPNCHGGGRRRSGRLLRRRERLSAGGKGAGGDAHLPLRLRGVIPWQAGPGCGQGADGPGQKRRTAGTNLDVSGKNRAGMSSPGFLQRKNPGHQSGISFVHVKSLW